MECILCNQLLQQCILVSSSENHVICNHLLIFSCFFLIPKCYSFFNWNRKFRPNQTNFPALRYDKNRYSVDTSKKEDRLKSFIERKQRWWAHLYLNSKYQNRSLQDDKKSKEFLEAETKEIIGKTHRTNKLVISKLVSTRCAQIDQKRKIDSNHSLKGNKDDELICT